MAQSSTHVTSSTNRSSIILIIKMITPPKRRHLIITSPPFTPVFGRTDAPCECKWERDTESTISFKTAGLISPKCHKISTLMMWLPTTFYICVGLFASVPRLVSLYFSASISFLIFCIFNVWTVFHIGDCQTNTVIYSSNVSIRSWQ